VRERRLPLRVEGEDGRHCRLAAQLAGGHLGRTPVELGVGLLKGEEAHVDREEAHTKRPDVCLEAVVA